MTKQEKIILWVAIILGLIAIIARADVATIPANLSARGVAEWAILGQHISSGTGALPAVASAGSRYTDLSTPTAPLEYRSNGLSWVAMTASGTGSAGVASHSLLLELDYGTSGHIGFIATAPFNAHVASQTDPHGASMTIRESLSVGSGSFDAFIFRDATGTIGLASYVYIPEEMATPTPTILKTGTIWMDGNTGKMRVYSNETWNDLW